LRKKEQNQLFQFFFFFQKKVSAKKVDFYSLGETPDPSIVFLKKILYFSPYFVQVEKGNFQNKEEDFLGTNLFLIFLLSKLSERKQ
jgi:hypothetical protein